MTLLCLDTTMARCSVALYDTSTEVILAAEAIDMAKGHAEVLPIMVARVLAAASLHLRDICRIAVTTGPGTFTGQRIGLSFAKGLALTRDIPVAGIDSLTAIAKGCGIHAGPIAVVIDARLDQFYFSLFNKNGTIEISPRLAGLTEILEGIPAQDLLVLGTGAEIVQRASGHSEMVLSADLNLPKASRFAHYAAGLVFSDGTLVHPLYLRSADAKPQPQKLRPAPDVVMRKAENQDLATLVEIHGACFADGWSVEALEALLAAPASMAIIAEVDHIVVGFALVRMAADEAEILTICLDPTWQRRKIGGKLLDSLISLLRDYRLAALFLEVAEDNIGAINLYLGRGFIKVGGRKSYYARWDGPHIDALVLKLALSDG